MNDDSWAPCFFQWVTDDGQEHMCFEHGKHKEHICDGGAPCPERKFVIDGDTTVKYITDARADVRRKWKRGRKE